MAAWLYVLRLQSGGLYIGSTANLDRRIEDHLHGHGCRTTRCDKAVELLYEERYETIEQAERREYQLKHWTRAKKEALIAGDTRMLKSLARPRGK
jgi:putative endonuclease